MDPSNGQLEEFVLPLRFDDLILKKVLVLFESLCARRPMLDLLVKLLLFILNLLPLAVQTVHLLVQLVNGLVLQCIVAILGVELLNERFQFFLLCLHVDRVAFQIVVLLLFQLLIKLGVQLFDHIVKFLLSVLQIRVVLGPFVCGLLPTDTLSKTSWYQRKFCSHLLRLIL